MLRPLVSIVDDDQSVRESLPELLRELGFSVQAFASAEEFLAWGGLADTACLILDMAMPGMSGLELQQRLQERATRIPIVFITAQWDDGTLRAQVMQLGAVDCLFKPFSDSALIYAVNAAVGAR